MSGRVERWEVVRQRALAAIVALAGAYETGTDRGPALREIERAALALAMLGSGIDPELGPWDPDRSRQLDLELVASESVVRR